MGLRDYSSRPRRAKGLVGGFFQLMLDLVVFALMLLGVVGILYRFFMPEGWLSRMWDAIWKQNPAYSFLLLGVVVAVFVLGKGWLDSINFRGKPGDFIVYAWMAVGAYFGFHFLTTGSL
jgi:hypothetical protein